MRTHLLIWALFLSVVLVYLQVEANLNYLYWQYDWLDNVMHFLGGTTLGLFFAGFFHTRSALRYVSVIAAIAIGWEVFEYAVGIPREANYALDTLSDLTMDALGAALAYVIVLKTLWRSR